MPVPGSVALQGPVPNGETLEERALKKCGSRRFPQGFSCCLDYRLPNAQMPTPDQQTM